MNDYCVILYECHFITKLLTRIRNSYMLCLITIASIDLYTEYQNDSSLNQSSNSIIENITCRSDFSKVNNVCQPRCDRFEQGTHIGTQIMIYSELVPSCVALLICILIMILSIKNYKTM